MTPTDLEAISNLPQATEAFMRTAPAVWPNERKADGERTMPDRRRADLGDMGHRIFQIFHMTLRDLKETPTCILNGRTTPRTR